MAPRSISSRLDFYDRVEPVHPLPWANFPARQSAFLEREGGDARQVIDGRTARAANLIFARA
jgi:hypothetical protein